MMMMSGGCARQLAVMNSSRCSGAHSFFLPSRYRRPPRRHTPPSAPHNRRVVQIVEESRQPPSEPSNRTRNREGTPGQTTESRSMTDDPNYRADRSIPRTRKPKTYELETSILSEFWCELLASFVFLLRAF